MKPRLRIFPSALIAALVGAGPALAQKSADISDLVGARERRSGDAEMEARGFFLHHRANDADGSWMYWWSPEGEECVQILSSGGRYEQVQPVAPIDCGQASASSDDAASLAALSLAHDSHAHADDQHLTDPKAETNFERGFRNGLYNTGASSERNSDYTDGYTEGVSERRRRTSYPRDVANTSGALKSPPAGSKAPPATVKKYNAAPIAPKAGATTASPLASNSAPSGASRPITPSIQSTGKGAPAVPPKAGSGSASTAKKTTTTPSLSDDVITTAPAQGALADLAYQDLAWAQIEMQRRGYSYAATDLDADYFLNRKTGKCVALVAERGKVTDVNDVAVKNCR